MIKRIAFILSIFSISSVLAQGNADEMVYREAKRLKATGITTLALGTTITASGITLIASNYNNFKEGGSRANEDDAKSKERGGYVVGGLITAMGVGVNLTAIPIFKRRSRMIEEARSDRFSLIASPNGIRFAGTF